MSRGQNLIGQKKYLLTILEKTNKRKGTSIIWKCVCDCGNITYASTSELNSGHKKSCGCLHTKQRSELGKSKGAILLNQSFGDLIVVEKTDLRKDGRIVWKCKCSCGKYTYATTSDLTQNRKTHCEFCQIIKSKGEKKICQLLEDANISFIREKTFDNLKSDNNRPLRFDFYLPEKGYLIEFDGKQHFKEDSGYGSDLKNIQLRDDKKNQYCFDNNLILIRIPFTHLKELSLQDLLLETSTFVLKKE